MRKLNLFKSGLTALMMAFAVTLSFSCSKDDEKTFNKRETFTSGEFEAPVDTDGLQRPLPGPPIPHPFKRDTLIY